MPAPYVPRRSSRTGFLPLRGLHCHVHQWGDAGLVTADKPPLVLTHGWMDVAASFQFVVDALAAIEGESRWIIAPDWRGFGLSTAPPVDSYWFPDYLGDLDALLDALVPERQVDLLGHSMGGNVVMSYAGVRPQRIRRLINLEGFGMPHHEPPAAPKRLAAWLDELKAPQTLRSYASVDAVAQRLLQNNVLLPADKAAWLAPHWSQRRDDGRWHILGDPAHKRVNPILYNVAEVLEAWKRIEAPMLWVEGDRTDTAKWWGTRYSRAEFHTRLAVVAQVDKVMLQSAGHMLHHDQPEALAGHLRQFLA